LRVSLFGIILHIVERSALAMSVGMLLSAPITANAASHGLSLRIDDGVATPVELVGNPKRHFGELDIIASVATADDQGITPVTSSGDLAHLDWTDVELVDEEWRPDGAGAFTRQRFYRNARWMENPGFFVVYPIDAHGHPLPAIPFLILPGTDDVWSGLDSAFVRRFFARQTTTGCAAVDDCSGATGHVAQALVQLREPQYPSIGARRLPSGTKALRVFWTADPFHVRDIPVSTTPADDADFTYGFGVELEAATPPGNGEFYVPGEAITFSLHFTDGAGNPLDDGGVLPTYADFLDQGTDSGLRYFDIGLNPTLFYALKHREGNLLLAMGGPSDSIGVTDYTVPITDFFLPEVPVAFAAEHGFSAVVAGVPPLAVILGGLFDPTVWNAPVSNEVVLHVPADALAGTYVVALKARRDFAGEAINAGDVLRIQVGTSEPTAWEPTTGGCNGCHVGQAALGNILHGIGDRESCLAACHSAALGNEPDGALDYRIHFVHARSDRYPADPNDCMVCHVEQPDDDPRGYPGFGWPFD
jgi:hypothetical protein